MTKTYDVSLDHPFPDWLVPGVILTVEENEVEIKNAFVMFEHIRGKSESIHLFRLFGTALLTKKYLTGKLLDWYINWTPAESLETKWRSQWLQDDHTPNYYAYDVIEWRGPNHIWLKDNITVLDNTLSPITYPYGKEFQPILRTIRKLEQRQAYYQTFIKGKTA